MLEQVPEVELDGCIHDPAVLDAAEPDLAGPGRPRSRREPDQGPALLALGAHDDGDDGLIGDDSLDGRRRLGESAVEVGREVGGGLTAMQRAEPVGRAEPDVGAGQFRHARAIAAVPTVDQEAENG